MGLRFTEIKQAAGQHVNNLTWKCPECQRDLDVSDLLLKGDWTLEAYCGSSTPHGEWSHCGGRVDVPATPEILLAALCEKLDDMFSQLEKD